MFGYLSIASAGLAALIFFINSYQLPAIDWAGLNQPAESAQPARYAFLIEKLALRREKLAEAYNAAETDSERDLIVTKASNTLEEFMPQLMRCWLTTPWDFNGTSTTPGEEKIACGYFVSVIMRDAGFKVNRIRLAQQPSQNILRTFLPRQNLNIYTQTSYEKFLKKVRDHGLGIYIVGLDKHVAFIVNLDDEIRYIHSSGGASKSVVDQSTENASSLKRSKYRVIGNLTTYRPLIVSWLENQTFKTHS